MRLYYPGKRIPVIFLLGFCLLSITSNAQDKAKVKKQFMELLLAYPSKFENLSTELEGAELTMKVPEEEAVVMAMFPDIRTPAAAQADYKKWKKIIETTDFNGATLLSTGSKTGGFYLLEETWKLDDHKFSLDNQYKGFHIQLALLKTDQHFNLFIYFGDKEK
ncbi:MAG: hypothetical protein HYZ15_07115 [Sphingobacteriales bacterium]|nr:hypothetical protein [Sphingobacteriales bacterium]